MYPRVLGEVLSIVRAQFEASSSVLTRITVRCTSLVSFSRLAQLRSLFLVVEGGRPRDMPKEASRASRIAVEGVRHCFPRHCTLLVGLRLSLIDSFFLNGQVLNGNTSRLLKPPGWCVVRLQLSS